MFMVAVELLATLVPYAWVALTSRPPSEAGCGVPQRVGYVCARVPRFTLFVVATLILEIYVATSTAQAVTATSCRDRPWRSLMIYCLNIPVLVCRTYSAFLAVRLQDRLVHTTRRVLPFYRSEKAPAKRRDRPK